MADLTQPHPPTQPTNQQLLDATLKGQEGLAPLAAVIPRWPHTAWKHLVGGLELWLSFLWMTPKWRTAGACVHV